MEHDKPYWYDKSRDLYVVHLPSKKNPVTLPGDSWKTIREADSNWDGTPASVNELARKLGLARKTITELLRAMQTTHDSAPWTDEEIGEAGEDSLIEDLLRRKEEKVLVTAERKEWSKIKKDADSFRRVDLVAKRLALRFEKIVPKYEVPKLKLPNTSPPYSIVVSPTDFHFGKYAPEYTGDAYDRAKCTKRLKAVTKNLMGRITKRGRPQRIFLALGGDGLHIDNQNKTTTRGTPQDCDGTPEEMAWGWVKLCRDYVDMLRQISPVTLLIIPGNHDYYTATLLRAAMQGWFHKTKDVEVVESFSPRQYVAYGSSLITFLHGDAGKPRDWPAIIAGERPKEWGESKHRFIFCGHLHTERDFPVFGNVTVYRMPSLAGTDNWHFKQGYKSRKALIAYVVDQKRGVIATEIEPVGD